MEINDITRIMRENIEKTDSLYVIASVTRQCVLKCRYCYAVNPENNKIEVMSDNVLEKLIKDSLLSGRKKIKFEWSGGESFLAGVSFYEKVIQLQKKWKDDSVKYSNCIQTSGAVCNKKLIDFLVENKFHIGLTIDGIEETHNYHRPTPSGKESYKNVTKTFKYIKKKQGDCGTLCTVTKMNSGLSVEIAKSFSDIGVNGWHSNFYVFDANKPLKDQELAISSDDFYKYLKEQADYYLDENPEGSIPKTLKMFLHQLSGLQHDSICSYSGSCIGSFINIDNDGNATLCPKFIGSAKYKIGNITQETIKSLISPTHKVTERFIHQRARATKTCLDDKCNYFNLCKSGCPYLSTLSQPNGDMSNRETLCEGKRELFGYLEKRLEDYGVKSYSSQIVR